MLCLTDTSLYIYICVKHFRMANIKKKKDAKYFTKKIVVLLPDAFRVTEQRKLKQTSNLNTALVIIPEGMTFHLVV